MKPNMSYCSYSVFCSYVLSAPFLCYLIMRVNFQALFVAVMVGGITSSTEWISVEGPRHKLFKRD